MRRFISIVAASTFLSIASAFPALPWAPRDDNASSPITDFASIPVNKDLNWVPCYDQYTCTNLEVPLDYENATAGTTNIAFIKWTSPNGTGQDILFNPGGPGGSGVYVLQALHNTFLKSFGDQYNFVSFDPRGVNNSGPLLTCFPGAPDERTAYNTIHNEVFNVPWSEKFQRATAAGKRCSAMNQDTDARYVGTSAVVQDMMYFSELQAKANGKNPNDVKVWYYGASYGTVIGQTFAAMYPDKVGRMILDANVYGQGHYIGEWATAIENTDIAVRSFFENCYEAGLENCVFAGNSTSADAIEDRVRAMLDSLEEEPLAVSDPSLPIPDVVTRAVLENFIFQQMYQPQTGFIILAQVLYELEKGNGTLLLSATDISTSVKLPNQHADENESSQMINCIDVNSRWNLSLQKYEALVEEYELISYYGGASMVSQNTPQCNGMSIMPPKSQIFPGFTETATYTPILMVNGLRDPVAPIASAEKNSRMFKDSVVLAQDTTGHGFMAVPSSCTIGHLQAYLADATLPPLNTVCEPDVTPLVDAPTPETKRSLEARGFY